MLCLGQVIKMRETNLINMKKAALVAGILLFSGVVFGQQGYVVEQGPSDYSPVIYNWGSSNSNSYYQDALAGNPDLGTMVCNPSQNNPYLGLVAVMDQDDSPVWNRMDYTTQSSTLAQADNSVSFNGDSCQRTSISALTISPSEFSGNTPSTKVAAHPAKNYLLVSGDSTGTNPTFLDANSELGGSYSGSLVYTYSTNSIEMDISSINVNSDIGFRSYDISQSGRGISSERPLLAGVCNNGAGSLCETGVNDFEDPNSIPITYTFDVNKNQVNDQNVYTRFGVANGKQFNQLDIGADSEISNVNIDLDPIYYSQTQEVDFNIENTGNVPITSSFDVKATIEGPFGSSIKSSETVYEETFTISDDLSENGGSTSRSFDWPAEDISGRYDVTIQSDINDDLNEINEGDTVTRSFELRPITLPDIRVDGELKDLNETEFEKAGVPYNFSIQMKNSDGVNLPNADVQIVEGNGTSSFAPTQGYNRSTSSGSELENLDITSSAEIKVDDEGKASVTLIPTGNVMLKEEYNNTELSELVNYSLHLEGSEQDGTEFTFVINEQLTNEYPLKVDDPGYVGSSTGKNNLPNLDTHTKAAMNRVYSIFASFWRAVV